jgi:hypothetical protein
MDAEDYMREIVEPTIKDFEESPTSVRHAFLACVVTYHCVDYLSDEESAPQLRQKFREGSKDFALVDRIAHAFKHVNTGHERSKHIQPLEAGEVISRPPGIWGVAVWDVSRWDDPVGGVTIKGEAELDVFATVTAALAFLRSKVGR